MRAPRAEEIGPILDAVTVMRPFGYTWLGERFEVTERVSRPDETATPALSEALARRLYDDCYCTGGVAPASDLRAFRGTRWGGHPGDDLLAANRGSGRREDGWLVAGMDGEDLLLSRRGLTVRAPAAAVGANGRRPGAGDAVTLTMTAAASGLFHTTIYGDALPVDPPDERIDRFYWNVRPEGRVALTAKLTGTLNDAGLPFRLKLFSDATVRCDAAVLYVPASRRPDAVPLVRAVFDEVVHVLRVRTPLFSRRLAAGLGFAEDPPDADDSFGTHRCRIVAAGIVAADEMGITTPGEMLGVVEGAFHRAGLLLRTPYLNPGADPLSAPEPFAL